MSDLAIPLDNLRWLRTAETLPGAKLPWLRQRREAARERLSRLDWPERREEPLALHQPGAPEGTHLPPRQR